MGATTKPSSRVGMPICWMFCALRVRDETEFAAGGAPPIAVRKLPRKERKSVQSHSVWRASPIKPRATEKKSAPAYTEIKGNRCGVRHQTPHHEDHQNASIMPTRELRRENIAKSQPGSKKRDKARERARAEESKEYGRPNSARPKRSGNRQPKVISGTFHGPWP